jgi:AcrR family transcriptional regulator
MSKTRQQRYSEEVRGRIVEIAQKIILEEGIVALSVRRVAKEMDYSAPIIYHYFRDKTQLLSCAVQEGYQRILESVKQPDPGLPPDEVLRLSFRYFIESAMLVPHAYKSFILNYTSGLLAEEHVLTGSGESASLTLAKIIDLLEAGVKAGIFAPCDVSLTAKVCWITMFGLFHRLIVEPDVPVDEREALINRHLDVMIRGISK